MILAKHKLKKIGIFLLLIGIFCSTNQIQAGVVVIPALGTSETEYKKACQREGYTCTNDFITGQLNQKDTPLYNELISELNLVQDDFLIELTGKIKNILELEQVSIEQMDSLISILERASEVQVKNKTFKLLKSELTQLRDFVNRSESDFDSRFYIFKKRIPELPKNLLKTISFKPLSLEISIDSLTLSGKSFPFQMDSCLDAKINPALAQYFKNTNYVFFKSESCGVGSDFSEIFASSEEQKLFYDPNQRSEPGFFSRNKSVLLWMSAMIGVGVLASQYEIKVEY